MPLGFILTQRCKSVEGGLLTVGPLPIAEVSWKAVALGMRTEPSPLSHMDQHPENKGGLVQYDVRFDSYSLAVSHTVSQQIQFCPWCGARLPPSQRARWFEELEAIGIDPIGDDYPESYSTDEWRR